MACAAFTALATSACTGNSPNLLGGSAAVTPGQPLTPTRLGSRFHVGHVYIADGYYNVRNQYKVYKFPLVNGVVDSKPDAVLNAAPPQNPHKKYLYLFGMAIDQAALFIAGRPFLAAVPH